MHRQNRFLERLKFVLLLLISVLFMLPIFIILLNSFKGQFYISSEPFALPNSETFVGFNNYISGFTKTGYVSALMYSLFITIFSVIGILFFTTMASWYIVRVKNKLTNAIYYLFVFAIIVPFQMLMFTMSWVANVLSLDNPIGIVVLYIGFGAPLAVFMFVGFIKSVPKEIEEAASIDGCSPVQTFFKIVVPILKSTSITVAILNTMWIWNDYLLPYLVIGNSYKTLPIAVQGVLTGSYGSRDMGAMMAMLILTIIPIIIFYLSCQKHIIGGIVAGAVKG